ncbi:MAG: FG-GAP repeat domain-containing protein, partial [Bacteroidia bacterium]
TLALGLLSMQGCSPSLEGRFELLSPSETGIDFTNEVPENDSLNQFTYHYLYNGNGVGIGDLDNDGLPEVFVSGNSSSSRLYRNKGNMQFEDITEAAGVSTSEWCTGVSFADVNNDGLLDIYVCRSGPSQNGDKKRNLLFVNQGNLNFKEEAKAYGLDDPGNATTASFLDYDRDGDLDLYVANHADRFFSDVDIRFSKTFRLDDNSQQHLYRNDGGHFQDVSEEAGVKAMGYALSATVFDINADGWDDIYVCNDYHVPDYVLINNQQGGFVDENAQRFKHTSNNSMGSDQADINNDGKLDFLSVDMLADDQRRFMTMGGPKDYDYTMVGFKNGYGYQYMKNALQINHGQGAFSDEAYLFGIARTDWSWSPLFVDFDGDGYQDLHITNGYYRDVTDQDFMLFQNRKQQQEGKGVTHEELLSMLPFEKISNYAFLNQKGKGFEKVTETWGLEEPSLSTGSAYGDLDGDGDADLIICN